MTRYVVPKWEWEWAYTVDIICDHYLHPDVTAPDRIVSRISGADRGAWRLPRPLRTGEAPLSPEGTEDAERHWAGAEGDAEQTFFGELRHRIADLPEGARGEILRDPAARRRVLTDRRTGRAMGENRWRFHCADCGDTLPVVSGKLEPVLNALVSGGFCRLSLAQLRGTL